MNIFFADLTKRKDTILIHSHQMAILVLAVVIFLLDSLKEKRSVPLNSQALHILKTLAAHQLKITALRNRRPSNQGPGRSVLCLNGSPAHPLRHFHRPDPNQLVVILMAFSTP